MNKLRIEELQVESFVTSNETHERGSVQAYVYAEPLPGDGEVVAPGGSEAYATCKQTCPYTCVYTQDPRQCPALMWGDGEAGE